MHDGKTHPWLCQHQPSKSFVLWRLQPLPGLPKCGRNPGARLEMCELSFDPEVATLFGKEIGQSNGDILLTDC
jgi:hypothetical protein